MRKIRYTRLQITRATLLHTRKVHIRDTLQTRSKLLLMVRAYTQLQVELLVVLHQWLDRSTVCLILPLLQS
jgi:hypothetical protein